MLLVPAWVWRGGPIYRAVCAGVPSGVFVAALVFAESGVPLGALVAFVVMGIFTGIATARRMGTAWPSASGLRPGQRVAVSSAVRRGRGIADATLAPAAIEYARALLDAGEQARRREWVLWVGGAAMLVFAVIDSVWGTFRLAAVSWLVVALFAVEILWWPRARNRLLANAHRTRASAAGARGPVD
ncbi:hypothetical protein [Mycobacterium sp. Marseille-P9652]|uniref:hypothetical protein n=1 Tax=Mycobacterium sp. Marseille-P9652 TaxID=2654950 RepID=UPI0012E70ED8|nr:hypothetical protein [Mycobacterium sp. Marseille-P9652]